MFTLAPGFVLRFYCQWADDKMYGEIRPYIVHYFLADDTVEVQEVSIPNSGRDPFPSLLKRQKLPKNFHEVGMVRGRTHNNTASKKTLCAAAVATGRPPDGTRDR